MQVSCQEELTISNEADSLKNKMQVKTINIEFN